MNEQEMRKRMEKTIAALDDNLRKLRTGRANVSLVQGVKVEAYGTMMPVEQLATISLLDYRTMMLQPWDKQNMDAIARAITAANLGMTPIPDNDVIRISVPELTEERRKELTKVVGSYEEEAKIALRQIRKDIIESVKNDKESTEDDVRGVTEKADRIIKEFNELVAQECDRKRKEMMEV